MKGFKWNDGYNMMKEDGEFMQDSLQEGTKNRSKDLFGIGGFISGGIVTPNGVNPDNIDITAGIGYDANGERFTFTSQSNLVLPFLPGNNWVLVSYQTYEDTQKADPTFGTLNDTRVQEQFNIEIKASFTQGDVDSLGNPYVPIALVTKPSSLNIDQSARVDLLNLKVDSVDTDQLVNSAVVFSKLANSLRPLIWTPDEPNIYYDKETGYFRTQSDGSFILSGGVTLNIVDGFPIARIPTYPNIMLLTPSVVPNHWDVSVVSSYGFDPNTLTKSQIILGYLNEHDQFVNLQASTPDEIVRMSEDETSATRISMHENMWRRRNEAFRSYTPDKLDGATSNTNGMLVSMVGPSFQVAAGVSYVAGRRLTLTAPILLDGTNTNNYGAIVGSNNVYLWIHRTLVSGKRFTIQLGSATPPDNSYLLARVEFDGGGSPVAVYEDKRKFTPIEQIDVIETAIEYVRLGAELRWKSDTEVIVSPGVVGFSNGEIRKTLSDKPVVFGQPFQSEVMTQDWPEGRLDSANSPENFQAYAVFAIAEHDGEEFNVVASKIPYFDTVEKIGPNHYRILGGSMEGLFVGQRIRVCALPGAPKNIDLVSEANFSGVDINGQEGEIIQTIVGNEITTSGQGPTNAFVPATGGNIVVLDHLRPRGDLTGIDTKFRFLGAFITAPSGNKLRAFIQEGEWYRFQREIQDSVSVFVTNGNTIIRDLKRYAPPMADSIKANMYYGARANAANGEGSQESPFARLARRVGEVTNTAGTLNFFTLAADFPHTLYSLSGGVTQSNPLCGYSGECEQSLFLNTVVSDCQGNNSIHVFYSSTLKSYRVDFKREWVLQPFSAIPTP